MSRGLPRTYLHEAVCVLEARQHHLLRDSSARRQRCLRFSRTGRRHFSGLHGSSRESASADAVCTLCACVKATFVATSWWEYGLGYNRGAPHPKNFTFFLSPRIVSSQQRCDLRWNAEGPIVLFKASLSQVLIPCHHHPLDLGCSNSIVPLALSIPSLATGSFLTAYCRSGISPN